MKLKTFTPANTLVNMRNVNPHISLCAKSGVIKLSARFVEDSPFKPGDLVAFTQDEDNPENWYLHAEESGFKLLIKGHNGRCKVHPIGFSSKDICLRLLERTSLKGTTQTVIMGINPEPVTLEGRDYYEIATKSARISYRGKHLKDGEA